MTTLLETLDMPDNFTFPFQVDAVTAIFISCRRDMLNKEFGNWTAWVEFKNGKTEGKQHFKSDSIVTIIEEIKNFLATLEQ